MAELNDPTNFNADGIYEEGTAINTPILRS